MSTVKRYLFFGGVCGAMLLAAAFFFLRDPRKMPQLPPAHKYRQALPLAESAIPAPPASEDPGPLPSVLKPSDPPTPTPLSREFPHEVNLAVPFTVQAPHQNWDLPYKEFCEEASMVMAASFVLGKDIPGADYADVEMWKVKAFEEKRLGYYEDTTAEEVALILREYWRIPNVAVVYEPTVADIKKSLAEGRAVIMPAAGRMLGNPYFRQPGPLYHMLVIKGYTRDGRFITNDPGTRRGADFLYSPEVLLNAMHDWNGGNVTGGRKVMVVVG